MLRLTGVIASLDGSVCLRKSSAGPVDQAAPLGRRLAEEILRAGGGKILEEIEKTAERQGTTSLTFREPG